MAIGRRGNPFAEKQRRLPHKALLRRDDPLRPSDADELEAVIIEHRQRLRIPLLRGQAPLEFGRQLRVNLLELRFHLAKRDQGENGLGVLVWAKSGVGPQLISRLEQALRQVLQIDGHAPPLRSVGRVPQAYAPAPAVPADLRRAKRLRTDDLCHRPPRGVQHPAAIECVCQRADALDAF